MSEQGRGVEQYVGLGIVIGAVLGLIVALLGSWNIGLAIAIGAGVGLIAGAVFDLLKDRA